MNSYEILVLIIIGFVLAVILITYLFHGRKLTKKNKAEKVKPKVVEEKPKEEKKEEQKPVAVGIIKENKSKAEEILIENDLAPFKELPKVENNAINEVKKQSIQDEIKNLSPEMKKVIMSDILKPRF